MYGFLVRPKWIVSHVFVAGLVVTMIALGFWQLDRLDQRRSTNDEVTSRLEEPITAVTSLASIEDGYRIGEEIRFRLATASGSYLVADEVLVLNRSLNGAPGYWVLTPLILDDGTGLVVNRGWIPFRLEPGTPRPEAAPPAGTVVVTGMVRETVEPQGIQSADREGVVLDALARPDLERFQQQLDYPILPVYLQLEADVASGTSTDGGQLSLPVLVPRPDLDEGTHFSYAMQWFIFSLVGLIGYPLVLRRIARTDGSDGRHSDIPVDYL